MTEPSELAGRRAERSQRLRDQSPDVLVALPSSDGELVRALGDLEEVLRLVDLVDAGPQALPPPLNEGRAAEAVGKLASSVASAHCATENGHPGVQPVGPTVATSCCPCPSPASAAPTTPAFSAQSAG